MGARKERQKLKHRMFGSSGLRRPEMFSANPECTPSAVSGLPSALDLRRCGSLAESLPGRIEKPKDPQIDLGRSQKIDSSKWLSAGQKSTSDMDSNRSVAACL